MKKQRMNWAVVPAVLLVVAAIVVVIVMSFGGGQKDGGSKPADGTPSGTSTPTPDPNKDEKDNAANSGTGTGTGSVTPSTADAGAVQELVNLFNEAYFVADANAIKNYLSDDFSGTPAVYTGNGAISDITVTVQADVTGAAVGSLCPVQVRYVDSQAGDTYQYLTLQVLRQATGWKVQSYTTGA